MSLPALALLLSAACALRDVAPDWLRVEIAPREPIKMAEDGSQVLVAVYTGDEMHKVQGRRWFGGARTVELAVQVLLPPKVTATFEGVTQAFEAHRAGADVVFATVHRYLELAFEAPERGSWGEVWQSFVIRHDGDLEGRPFIAETPKGVQIPAVDYSLPCSVIGSPPLGQPVDEVWSGLIAKMRATPSVADAADYVAALIKGRPLAPWHAELVLAGLSRREGTALGLGTLAGLDGTPTIEALTIAAPNGTTTVAVGYGGGP